MIFSFFLSFFLFLSTSTLTAELFYESFKPTLTDAVATWASGGTSSSRHVLL